MRSIPATVESMYRANFRGELPTSPVIRYKKIPSFCPTGSNVQDKEKILALSKPRRVGFNMEVQHTPSPPTSTAEVSTKPPPRSGPKLRFDPNHVFNTKHGPMKMATVDKLYEENRYKTSAQKHYGAEFAIPFQKVIPPDTTKEERPDMIRLRCQRYDQRAGEWQDAVLWDRIQSRNDANQRPKTSSRDKLLIPRETCNLQDQTSQKKIQELLRTDKLAGVFVRKCSGYAGYLPLCPPEIGFADKKSPPEMTTIMNSSYRNLPEQCYTDHSRYARTDFFLKVMHRDVPVSFLIENQRGFGRSMNMKHSME